MAFDNNPVDLAVTVINIDSGRRVRSYRVSLEPEHVRGLSDFEDEAWRRAVQDKLVAEHSRIDHCFELR